MTPRPNPTLPWRILALGLVLATAPLAMARGAGEYGWLKPGKDKNLNWMPFHEVAEQAAVTKKPVLVYFYEGEKSLENAGAMIDAQMRLFPDEKVRGAAAGFLCTQVDRTDPEAVERAIASEERKASRADRRRRRGGRGGKRGGGDVPGGDEKPAPEDPGAGEGEEGERGDKSAPPALILPTDQWAKAVSIYLLDYRGRPIQKITKISSNSRKFIQVLGKARVENEKRIKLDEKAAAKEAEEKAKAAGEDADPKRDSDKPDSGKPDSGDGGGADR